MPWMGKTEEHGTDWKLIPASCNFKNNSQETYLFVSDLFKFHSDRGRVNGKIKQNELDCRDTAPLSQLLKAGSAYVQHCHNF